LEQPLQVQGQIHFSFAGAGALADDGSRQAANPPTAIPDDGKGTGGLEGPEKRRLSLISGKSFRYAQNGRRGKFPMHLNGKQICFFHRSIGIFQPKIVIRNYF
jgi:hypothetical protein